MSAIAEQSLPIDKLHALKAKWQPDGSHDSIESPEQAFQRINTAIHQRRDSFIDEYKTGKHGTVALTYEPELDRAVYETLGQFLSSNQDAFQKAKRQLDDYTTFQLQTFLGERLNVGLSTYQFDLRDGVLYGQNMEEPLVGMIARGRDARNALIEKNFAENKIPGEIAVQIMQRQDAEVTQFCRVEEVMANPATQPGTTMISISPPAPGYDHNFYDVFILKEGKDGKRYVESRRYASALNPEESLKKAKSLQAAYGKDKGDMPLDAYFLAHPLQVDDPLHVLFNNPDGIHAFMHENYTSMNEQDFTLVKEVCAGIISVYLHEVFEHPHDSDKQAEILDALMNKADWAAEHVGEIRRQKQTTALRRSQMRVEHLHDEGVSQAAASVMADIAHFGRQTVRATTTGCGESGSFKKKTIGGISIGGITGSSIEGRAPGNLSPFSLLDEQKQEWFTCPECDYHATGPIGNQCPGCGLQKDKYKGPKCD